MYQNVNFGSNKNVFIATIVEISVFLQTSVVVFFVVLDAFKTIVIVTD